jgi:hypothetical protein
MLKITNYDSQYLYVESNFKIFGMPTTRFKILIAYITSIRTYQESPSKAELFAYEYIENRSRNNYRLPSVIIVQQRNLFGQDWIPLKTKDKFVLLCDNPDKVKNEIQTSREIH